MKRQKTFVVVFTCQLVALCGCAISFVAGTVQHGRRTTTHDCDGDATCNDGNGSFTCTCNAGYESPDRVINPALNTRAYSSLYSGSNTDGRLGSTGWAAEFPVYSAQWYQIDYGQDTTVTGVVIQSHGGRVWKVTAYRVLVRSQEGSWQWADNAVVFQGSTAGITTHAYTYGVFSTPVVARYIRLYVVSWQYHVGLRMGLLFPGIGTDCININECSRETDNCDIQSACADTTGSFTCTCNAGWETNDEGVNCTNVDECVTEIDDCDASNALCTDAIGSFTCNCTAGFNTANEGVTCDNLDECILTTHDCDSNATCTDSFGSFLCTCNTGWASRTGSNGTICIDQNECDLDTHDCDIQAQCVNSIASFTCVCNTGFEGTGVDCTDTVNCGIDDNCATSGSVCTDGNGSFTCTCNNGWRSEDNGVTCCPRPTNMWEYLKSSNETCEYDCYPGSIRVDNTATGNNLTTCIAATHSIQTSSVISLRVSAYDNQTQSWNYTGNFHRDSHQWLLFFAWSHERDPYGILKDVRNHPCFHSHNLCCLAETRDAYLTGTQLDLLPIDCTTPDAWYWVLQSAQTQGAYVNASTASVYEWDVSWDSNRQQGDMMLRIPAVTALQNTHSECTTGSVATTDGIVTCHMFIGMLYASVASRSRHQSKQITYTVSQQALQFQYTSSASLTLMTRQEHSCLHTSHVAIYHNTHAAGNSSEWFVFIDILLDDSFHNISRLNSSQTDLLVATGPKGSRMAYYAPEYGVTAGTLHPNVLTLLVRLDVRDSEMDTWANPVIDIHYSLRLHTCIEDIHIQSTFEHKIELFQSEYMSQQYSTLEVWVLYGVTTTVAFTPIIDYSTWTVDKEIAEFPAYRHGRLGLMAIATNSVHTQPPNNQTDAFIRTLQIIYVRGSTRQDIVRKEISDALTDADTLQYLCRQKYLRDCLLVHGITDTVILVPPEWIIPGPAVCDRLSPQWTSTYHRLQERTGMFSKWGSQQLLRYMQYVCSFASKHRLQIIFVATSPTKWPTFAPGIANPDNLADIVLTAVTVAS